MLRKRTNVSYIVLIMSALVLITGASGGIGEELARIFAFAKNDLILVARSKAKLEALATNLQKANGIKCHVLDMDLAKHGAALELYNRVISLNLRPNIIVNNAGFGEVGAFEASGTKNVEEMLTLNIETLTMITRYFLPDLIRQGAGRILQVASTAAFQPGPFMAVYYASKAYVLHFSEALSIELQGTGVTVTALCPGPVPSGFQERANMKNRLMNLPGILSAQAVAQIGYNALLRGQTYVIPGFLNWLVAFSIRFTPRWLVLWTAGRLNKNRT